MKKGFSLIEILIYLSISSLMLITIVSSAYPLFNGMERSKLSVMRHADTLFVNAQIRHALLTARSVVAPSLGTSDTLVIQGSDGNIIRYFTEDSSLMHQVNSEMALPLISSRSSVGNFSVSRANGTNGATLSIVYSIDGYAAPTTTTYVRF